MCACTHMHISVSVCVCVLSKLCTHEDSSLVPRLWTLFAELVILWSVRGRSSIARSQLCLCWHARLLLSVQLFVLKLALWSLLELPEGSLSPPTPCACPTLSVCPMLGKHFGVGTLLRVASFIPVRVPWALKEKKIDFEVMVITFEHVSAVT